MKRLYCILSFLVAVAQAPRALADFSSAQPIHHFFNSRLLQEEELTVNLNYLGTVEYGLTRNVEVGTSTFLLLGAIPNFIFKHRMFETNRTETSFASFNLLISRSQEGKTLRGFGSLHGIVTSYRWNDEIAINAGPMHIYALNHTNDRNSRLGDIKTRDEIDAYGVMAGADILLSSTWGLTTFTVIPVYSDISLTSDFADGNANFNPNPLFFASLTRAWDTFRFEFGLMSYGTQAFPYLAANWRFQ